MISKPELTQQIKSIISERLSIPIEKIEYSSRLGKDLEMDSFQSISLIKQCIS